MSTSEVIKSAEIANEAVAQWCRGKYVVDSYEVIGTGPLPLA